jgi:hypothetical protein
VPEADLSINHLDGQEVSFLKQYFYEYAIVKNPFGFISLLFSASGVN